MQVHTDGWHFTTDGGATIFFPFGANYTASDQGWAPDYLSDCYWDEAKIERDMTAMQSLEMNTLKIMLDPGRVVSTAQGPDLVTLDDYVMARFDVILVKAAAHGVKLLVAVQVGWHGDVNWFFNAGGDRSAQNRRLMEDFWRQVVTRVNTRTGVAYKDDPTIMAWSFAIETSNLTFSNQWGAAMVPLWQDWLKRRYITPQAVDAAWGLPPGAHGSFDQFEIPFCVGSTSCYGSSPGQYNGMNVAPYKDPTPPYTPHVWRDFAPETPENESTAPVDSSNRRKLLDFQYFRETVAAQWVKVQADAIKRWDPNHLTSIGLSQWSALLRAHYDSQNKSCSSNWPTVPVQQMYEEGPIDVNPYNPRELFRFLDFVDVHAYPGYPRYTCVWGHGEWPNYPNDPAGVEYADMTCSGSSGCGEGLELLRHVCRYAWAQTGKPVIVGEFGQVPDAADKTDLNRIKWYNTQAVYRSAGDASGWLGWSFTNWPASDEPKVGSITAWNGLWYPAVSPTTPLQPTPWGLQFRDLQRRAFANDPTDRYAALANGPRRANTIGTFDMTGALTDKDYLKTLGGMGTGNDPGPNLLETYQLGSMDPPASNVADFSMPSNTYLPTLQQMDSRVISHTVPPVVVQGAPAYAFKVRLRNTGNSVWPTTYCLAEAPSLGTCYPLGAPVFPGTEYEYNLTLTPPGAGCSTYQWVMKAGSSGNEFGEKLVQDVRSYTASSLGPRQALVVGAGGNPGSTPSVKTYALDADRRTLSQTTSFLAFPGETHGYGARIAIGNLDGLGDTEVAVAHGPQWQAGTGSTKKIDIWRKDFTTFGSPVRVGAIDLTGLFPPTNNPLLGLHVAVGDVDGVFETSCGGSVAKRDELIVGEGQGQGSGAKILVLKVDVCAAPTFTLWKSFTLPAPFDNSGGTSVATLDYDGDGRKEVVVGSGFGKDPTIFLYDYDSSCSCFQLKDQQPLFGPLGFGTSSIYDESHSVMADFGSEGPQPVPPCPIRTRESAMVSGGEIIPGCPIQEDIAASLGPFALVGPTSHPGWAEELEWDPAIGHAGRRYDWAVYGATIYGAVTAVLDLYGTKSNVIASAAGPDPAASSALHLFGRCCSDGQAVPDQRLLWRLEGLDPFPGSYGANVAGRPRSPTCLGGASAKAGPDAEVAGSPSFAAAAVADEIWATPLEKFASLPAFQSIAEAGDGAHAMAAAGNLSGAALALATLYRDLLPSVTDAQARGRIQDAIVRFDDRLAAYARNATPTASAWVGQEASAEAGSAMVRLDGAGSLDPDSKGPVSDIMEWIWRVDGTYAGSGRLVEIPVGKGSHDATLTVIDTVGHESTAEESFVVE